MEIGLDRLEPGQRGPVLRLELPPSRAAAPARLGLIPGAGIACLRRVPLGDPAVYRFGGLTAAMRRGDAAGIIVAPERADLGSSG